MSVQSPVREGIRDPLSLVRVLGKLEAELAEKGLKLSIGTNLHVFNALKLALRGERAHPYHDPEICNLREDRAYWMKLDNAEGRTVAIQAFRLDIIDVSLADWAPAYTVGLYMRRDELLVPMHAHPPENSIAERLSGRLVYQGELWIDPQDRRKGIAVPFGRTGALLSYLKWQPNALWSLVSQDMATSGVSLKFGYAHHERGFFRWRWVSDGIDEVEWLAVAERHSLEQLVNELETTPQQSRRA